jgi:hypothetical protein
VFVTVGIIYIYIYIRGGYVGDERWMLYIIHRQFGSWLNSFQELLQFSKMFKVLIQCLYICTNGEVIYGLQDTKEEINMLKQEIEVLQKGLRFVSIINYYNLICLYIS